MSFSIILHFIPMKTKITRPDTHCFGGCWDLSSVLIPAKKEPSLYPCIAIKMVLHVYLLFVVSFEKNKTNYFYYTIVMSTIENSEQTVENQGGSVEVGDILSYCRNIPKVTHAM